jgi:hypothetical protein
MQQQQQQQMSSTRERTICVGKIKQVEVKNLMWYECDIKIMEKQKKILPVECRNVKCCLELKPKMVAAGDY